MKSVFRASSALVSALACLTLPALTPPARAQCGGPFQLLAPDAAQSDQFGYAVAVSADTLIVGAPADDGFTGSAYIYRWNGSAWVFEAKLTASDAASGDQFGFSVSLSGDTALVGALYHDGPAGDDQGAAYVFTRSGPGAPGWTQQASLPASDAGAGDNFGVIVALSGDTAIVGAYLDDGAGGEDQGSAYIFTRSGPGAPGWTQQSKLTASDAAASDLFGASVAVDVDTVVIGAYGDSGTAGAAQGSAYIFTRSGTVWTQQAKLVAADAAASDAFGRSVAISSDSVIIGAPTDDGAAGLDQGSAYIFTRSGTVWTQQAKLNAADAAAIDLFGASVTLFGDTAIAGAYLDDGGTGSAHVFTRSGTTWTQQAKLTASEAAAGDRFGVSASLSGDTAIIGAYLDNGPAGPDQGSATVFLRTGDVWRREEIKLSVADAAAFDQFGSSVAISGDTAFVGAADDDGAAGVDQGSAYVFTRSGETWTQQAKLTAVDAAAGDQFGTSVAISGNTVIIGAPFDDGPGGADQGSAYVFTYSAGAWAPQAKITFSFGAAGDNFGFSVALSGDTALIGAPGYNGQVGPAEGGAFLFTRAGAVWTEGDVLLAFDNAPNDVFGVSVALSGDTAIVGASLDDGPSGIDQGSVHVFVRDGAFWEVQTKLVAPDAAAGDEFGRSVAFSGDTVIVGAPGDDSSRGSAHIFTRANAVWSHQAALAASDGTSSDAFGLAVGISDETAIVGASFAPPSIQGAAYVFTRSGIVWSERSKLTASDAASQDMFGNSVAVSDETAIVGAFNDNGPGGIDQGSAYIYFVGSECSSAVFNATMGVGYSTFATAFNAADLDHSIVAEAGAFASLQLLDTLSKGLHITSKRSISRPYGSSTVLSGGSDLATAAGGAARLFGDLAVIGGDSVISGDEFETGGGTSILIHAGSDLFLNAPDASLFGDTEVRSGAALGCLGPVTNHGACDLFGGAIDAASLTNSGCGTLTGAGDLFGSATNRGSITIQADTQVWDDFANESDATTFIQNGVLTILGVLTNTGTIIGPVANPLTEESAGESTRGGGGGGAGLFSSGDLVFSADSTLSMPAPGSLVSSGGDFDAAIDDHSRFDLREAELRLTSLGGAQTLEAMSTDIGATLDGLDRTMSGRYPLGTLRIGPGATGVTVIDTQDNDNAGQANCEAVYTENLIIEFGATLNTPTCKVYYVNLTNNGGTITTPSSVIAIPTLCPGDADGSGVVNFGDVLTVLANFGADYSPGTGPGDADGNSLVNFTDVLSVLANFGAVCP